MDQKIFSMNQRENGRRGVPISGPPLGISWAGRKKGRPKSGRPLNSFWAGQAVKGRTTVSETGRVLVISLWWYASIWPRVGHFLGGSGEGMTSTWSGTWMAKIAKCLDSLRTGKNEIGKRRENWKFFFAAACGSPEKNFRLGRF